jgi:aminomethyltransferase
VTLLLQHTPLYRVQQERGAQFTTFSGWDLPLHYGSQIEEHRLVRNAVGMFDVSHLRRILIEGDSAEGYLQRLVTCDIESLEEGRSRYGLLCNEAGGILDDVLIYRLGPTRYLMISNAGAYDVVEPWLERWAAYEAALSLQDLTLHTAMIAIQGPHARDLLAELVPAAADLPHGSCIETAWKEGPLLLARTGYTGEDGGEAIVPAASAERLWQSVLDRGAAPCGLGARDSLRLEAGLRLSGQDMNASTTPWEAALERAVDLEKGDFLGRASLVQAQSEGLRRRLVGFEMTERGVPRHGYAVISDGKAIGEVTSGGYGPSVDRFIGLAYVPLPHASVGCEWAVDNRGQEVGAKVVSLPFYRRRRS